MALTPAQEDERALLGAILSGYRDLPKLARIITNPTQDFEIPGHEWIWNASLAVHADGNQPDANLVRMKLGNLAQRLPGGASYLLDLSHDTPITFQAEQYAKAVHGHGVRRTLASLGAKLQQLTADQDADPDDILDRGRQWIDDQLGTRTNDGLTTVDDALEQVIEITEKGQPGATVTPWPGLNDLIGGWHPGNLITIGARPGVGKSILLENAATHTARLGGRVVFISLEMTAAEIMQRTVAHSAGVALSKVRNKIHRDDPDLQRIAAAFDRIRSANMVYADRGTQTLADIRATGWEQKQAARRTGSELALIVVDYMQLITSHHQRLTRQQQVGEFSRGLKQLAKELSVPVLAAVQLNRGGEQRTNSRPVLSDIRESGDVEQDSDIVILLHEETIEEGSGHKIPSGDIDLIVAKNRHGATGYRTVQKWGKYARMTEAA